MKRLVLIFALLFAGGAQADAIVKLCGFDSGEGGSGKWAIHTYIGSLWDLALGGSTTKASMVTYFNMDASEEAQLDSLINKYNNKTTSLEKLIFVNELEQILIQCEAGNPFYDTVAEVNARIQQM